jgi:hypothetical protein
MKWFYTPKELKNEFQKINDEHEESKISVDPEYYEQKEKERIEKAKDFDKQDQLDRIEKKIDELSNFIKTNLR